jgi:hypothetical protein
LPASILPARDQCICDWRQRSRTFEFFPS